MHCIARNGQRDAEPLSIGQDVLWQNQEHARDHLYTATRCVRFLDTSLAHLVEERRQPLLLTVLEYALRWLLFKQVRCLRKD